MQPLQMISIIALAFAFVFALVAILIYVRLNIRDVIRELSGKTATDEIARMREQGISRSGRGRSLESIIGGGTRGKSNNLRKVSDPLDKVAEEPMTEYLNEAEYAAELVEQSNSDAGNEPLTEYLASTVETEPMTEYLGDKTSFEPMTEYLGTTKNSEPMTEYLDKQNNAD